MLQIVVVPRDPSHVLFDDFPRRVADEEVGDLGDVGHPGQLRAHGLAGRATLRFFRMLRPRAGGLRESLERPFGHADPGDLFAWAGATASWPNRTDPGGSRGLDDYFTRDFPRNIGAESTSAPFA